MGNNDSAFAGRPQTGTENYGGPAITAGGLFSSRQRRMANSGPLTKEPENFYGKSQLPNAGFATPSVYEVNGKQFIVIACGGGKLHTSSGDSYVLCVLGYREIKKLENRKLLSFYFWLTNNQKTGAERIARMETKAACMFSV